MQNQMLIKRLWGLGTTRHICAACYISDQQHEALPVKNNQDSLKFKSAQHAYEAGWRRTSVCFLMIQMGIMATNPGLSVVDPIGPPYAWICSDCHIRLCITNSVD